MFINCVFHVIGNLIKTSVIKPLVENFTAKMIRQEVGIYSTGL
jgi:hypothetical protein